jgi:dihydropteroate synthase
MKMTRPDPIEWRGYRLPIDARTCIMGIVNVTPDSFSDGGRFYRADQAIDHALALADAGADIIDIGGESTRPFAAQITAKQEMQRVIPVIETLAPRLSIPISIDTVKAAVAQAAIDAGAAMINDISALTADAQMADTAAAGKVPVILMHMRGTPQTMQIQPHYDDLIGEIKGYLAHAVAHAERAGIERSHVIIDPGIGFGKTRHHNLILIKNLAAFQSLGQPVLIGASRKAFIRKTLETPGSGEIDAASTAAEIGTQAVMAAAILNGAHILRVHDVAATRICATMIDAIASAIET